MEEPPTDPCHGVSNHTKDTQCVETDPNRAQECDQEEHKFPCVHITEQPHAQRNRLGKVFDKIQREIERHEQRMATERSREKLVRETTKTLNLDAVINHEEQNAHGNAQRAGSGRK